MAVQLYHVVLGFPFHIAGAIATSRDEKLLSILVNNLYSEIGENVGKDHISIYREFLYYLQLDCSRPEPNRLWKETIELEQSCKDNYSNHDMGVKLGALFAFESMSSRMVEKWHNALTVNGYPNNAFRFFTIHIDIEKEHAADILDVCAHYYKKPNFLDMYECGLSDVNSKLVNFWEKAYHYREECNCY
ncbi:iron-containing redox enzyme family protein [Pseudoalteromonas peptidolytica]|nr:iron-containing redox enzyme family protein [Pseudoalteromonas peptidolytica]